MYKALLISALICLGISTMQTCSQDLSNLAKSFQKAKQNLSTNKNIDTFIDDLAVMFKSVPNTMEDCG